MKVQQLKQSVNLRNLEDWGKVGLPGASSQQKMLWHVENKCRALGELLLVE
ncbi:hypothetical protein [Paraburkholderia sp. HP33-1]|uniref:hypothetical protein n=1 Tax=Paraburkholderia sp. HP33-1 TaxID=2883243 RepID=UPI001F25A58A|nr:hypothetical protein [Paraburkholderia sp. HP33-1]